MRRGGYLERGGRRYDHAALAVGTVCDKRGRHEYGRRSGYCRRCGHEEHLLRYALFVASILEHVVHPEGAQS